MPMPPQRSQADWIRGFARQGMTREEIMGLLGVTRFRVNNALNRVLAGADGPPVVAADGCKKCGAAPFGQEPSRAGQCKRCGACGAHYRYWSARHVVPKMRAKMTRKSHCSSCGAAPCKQTPWLAGRVMRKPHCDECGATESRWELDHPDRTSKQCPERSVAAHRRELYAVIERKRAEEAERERLRHEEALAAEVDAGIAELLAELQAEEQRQAECAAAVAEMAGELEAERAAKLPPSKDRAAYQRAWREKLRAESLAPKHKPGRPKKEVEEEFAREVGAGLRQLFEERGGRLSKELKQRKLDEAADEFLRKHQSNMRANPPPELPPDTRSGWGTHGLNWRKDLGDTTDWRGELIAAARAGDEHARWRASELFGMEFAEAKCAS